MSGVAEQGAPDLARSRPAVTHAPTVGAWRLARGIAVGTTATGLALGGHLLGGGTVSLPAVTVLAAATVALSVAWSARRWTTGPLLGVLLGLQLVAHVAFAHSGHGHLVAGDGHPGHLTTLAISGHSDGAAMWAGHLLAGVLTALLLRRGEHWCWRLLELAGGVRRATRLLAARPVPARARLAVVHPTYVDARAALGASAHPHRGPPAFALSG